MSFIVENWGLINYQEALEKQLNLVDDIAISNQTGVLVFCIHPPVVTLGRGTQQGDVFSWQGPILEISRGGRATYHGPSQLMIYPILNLNLISSSRKARDIGNYLRNFEQAIVNSLKKFGIQAQGRSLQSKSSEIPMTEETGVWVENKKIASLGIGVKKWISYHGAAINLEEDDLAFSGMKPCGFSKETMTSVEKILGKKIDRKDLILELENELQNLL